MNIEDGACEPSWESEDEEWLQKQVGEVERDAKARGMEFPEGRRLVLEQHLRDIRLRQKLPKRPDANERPVPDAGEGGKAASIRETAYDNKPGGLTHIGSVIHRRGERCSEEGPYLGRDTQDSEVVNAVLGPTGSGNWFKCPHELFKDPTLVELTSFERLFYAFLWSCLSRYAKGNERCTFFCRDSEAAAALNVDKRTIRRGRRKLASHGLIRTRQGFARAKRWTEQQKVVFYELLDLGHPAE